MSNLVQCAICQNGPQPVELMNEHHKVPTSCGGPDTRDNKAWLHHGCHNNIHRLADKIRAGKNGPADDLATQIYPSLVARKRALELATIIARSFEAPGDHERESVSVPVELPARAYAALKVLAEERRRTRSTFGRKNSRARAVGISRLVTGIVIDHLRKLGYYDVTPR